MIGPSQAPWWAAAAMLAGALVGAILWLGWFNWLGPGAQFIHATSPEGGTNVDRYIAA